MDAHPHMRAAGVSEFGGGGCAAYCIQPDLDPSSRTHPPPHPIPDEQQRWRQSYRREPARRFVHAGVATIEDPSKDPFRHGITSSSGDKAGDCFQQSSKPFQSELSQFLNEQKEAIYRSNIREPLGHGYIRGHQLPAVVQDPNFRFGVSTSSSEPVKAIIYAPTNPPFHRSHGNVDASTLNQTPEEYQRELQSTTTSKAAVEYHSSNPSYADRHAAEKLITRPVNREYNWSSAGIDPEKHRFGKVVNANPATTFESGVQSALRHSINEEAAKTKIGSLRVEQVRAYQHDSLGKGTRQRGVLAGNTNDQDVLASGDHLNPSGHRSMTFGKPGQHDEWGARDCIRGEYTEEEQLPDPDLGKSKRKLTKLSSLPAQHADRAFGLPSIRADRPAPKLKSIANDMNYGDESNGRGLLYPSQFATQGVVEEDFLRSRPPQTIRSMFEKLGVVLDDARFERLVNLANQRYGTLSVDSFRHCWNQVRMGIVCEYCGETLCQHEDCKSTLCSHTPHANHSKFSRHIKQLPPAMIKTAGFTQNTIPAM